MVEESKGSELQHSIGVSARDTPIPIYATVALDQVPKFQRVECFTASLGDTAGPAQQTPYLRFEFEQQRLHHRIGQAESNGNWSSLCHFAPHVVNNNGASGARDSVNTCNPLSKTLDLFCF